MVLSLSKKLNSHTCAVVFCSLSLLYSYLYLLLQSIFAREKNTILYNLNHLEQTFSTNMHTYMISYYNPSVRIIHIFFSPLMLCVFILNISGRTYILKSTPNDRFYKKFFMAILFTIRVFARNLLRGNCRRNIFFSYFALIDHGPMSNKPTHYLLDYGDLFVSYN